MLCDICQGIFSHYWDEDDLDRRYWDPDHMIPHPTTLASLLRGRDGFCQLCFLVCESYDDKIADDDKGDRRTTFAVGRSKDRTNCFQVCIQLVVSGKYRHEFYFDVTPVEDSNPNSFSSGLTDSTDSETSQTQILDWIAKCSTEHSCCVPHNNHPWKPSRLVDLAGTRGPSYVQIVRSQEHFQSMPCEKYMTLSHCWSTAEFLKLQTDNQVSFESGILLQELPKTFQDAIKVTRFLGVRYLWIDCLCIIQNSPEDWLSEASTMANVYQHSYCNIGATGAPDGTHGLYFKRDPRWVEGSIINPKWPQALGKSYIVTSSALRLRHQQFTSQPLISRGWVVQERALAPRTIHYGKYQIFWECEHLFACQSIPHGITLLMLGYWNAFIGPNLKTRADPFKYWTSVVEQYSTCLLSHPEDKLIALSGIANHAHKRAPNEHDEYLAGIWKSDIPGNLLWFCVDKEIKFYRRSNYRAPSWSWASIDGAVVFPLAMPYSTPHQLITLESYSITNPDSNPYGRVTAGHLDLKGPFSQIMIERYPSLDYLIGRFCIALIGEVQIKTSIHARISSSITLDDVITTENSIGKGQLMYALVLQTDEALLASVRPTLDGLLLFQRGENSFERVGIFAMYFDTQEQLEKTLNLFPVKRVRLV